MTRLRLEMLGGFEILSDKSQSLTLKCKKAGAIMAFLATHSRGLCSRERLSAMFWGDVGEAQSRASLRQALTNLRRLLREAGCELIARGDHVGLPEEVQTDVVEFESALGGCDLRANEAAISLYKGEFLDGLRIGGDAYASWLLPERERLRSLATSAVTRLLDQADLTDPPSSAISAAFKILAHDPLHEQLHRGLMHVYMLRGDYSGALRQYRRCAEALHSELNTRPDSRTQALLSTILERQRGRRGAAAFGASF